MLICRDFGLNILNIIFYGYNSQAKIRERQRWRAPFGSGLGFLATVWRFAPARSDTEHDIKSCSDRFWLDFILPGSILQRMLAPPKGADEKKGCLT